MTDPVPLRDAFVWECPACGASNVEEPDYVELDEPMDDDPEGTAYACLPTTVLCERCLELFDVEVPE